MIITAKRTSFFVVYHSTFCSMSVLSIINMIINLPFFFFFLLYLVTMMAAHDDKTSGKISNESIKTLLKNTLEDKQPTEWMLMCGLLGNEVWLVMSL